MNRSWDPNRPTAHLRGSVARTMAAVEARDVRTRLVSCVERRWWYGRPRPERRRNHEARVQIGYCLYGPCVVAPPANHGQTERASWR